MRPEDYLRVVLRRWWLVPLIAIVAAAVAYAVTDRLPRVYNSSTALIANAVAAAFIERNAADNEALARQLRTTAPCDLPELRSICDRNPQLAEQLRSQADTLKWVELRQLGE